MNRARIAVADIGSNTLKLSVTEVDQSGAQVVVDTLAETVRLGRGLADHGTIAADRIDAAVSVLTGYELRARRVGATAFIGVATAAVRMASNGEEFLTRVRAETSWKIEVISGDEEARLTFLGLQAELPREGQVLLADIGGASTELIRIADGSVQSSISIPIGSGTLADQIFTTDPPGREEVVRARETADGIIGVHASEEPVSGLRLFLSGGNGTFLSQVAVWDRVRIPFVVPFAPMLFERLADIPAIDVARHIGIAEERAKVLPAGGAIAWAIIDLFQPATMDPIQSGIRGGVVATWFEANRPGA